VTGSHLGEALARTGVSGSEFMEPAKWADIVESAGLTERSPLKKAWQALKGGTEEATWTQKPRVRGLGGALTTTFAPVKAGERIGRTVEDINRLTPFFYQLRRGTDPAEAALRVALAQIDYSSRAFTPFEREVLKRAFPFYAFAHANTAYTLRQLWERPGGRMAQVIRILNSMRDPAAALPPHIAQTSAIPLPPGPSGDPRYMSGIGLMFEPAMEYVGNPKQVGLALASQLNPIAKAPMEYISGQTFFQRGLRGGRALTELDPTIGRLVSNVIPGVDKPPRLPNWIEHLSANLPTSRILTTMRTLTDPRKRIKPGVAIPGAAAWANVLTGLRVTDVPMSAQERVIKEVVHSLMEKIPGARAYERVYVPEELRATMPPEEQAWVEELDQATSILQKRQRARVEERKARQMLTPTLY